MPNLLNFFRWLENFNFVGWSFVVQVQAENLKSLTMNSKRKIKLCSRSKMVDQGTRSAKSRYEWKRGNQKKKEKILNYIQKPRKLYFIFDPPPFLISPYIETTALRQTRFLIYFKWNYFFFNFHVLVLFNIPQSDISLYAPMTSIMGRLSTGRDSWQAWDCSRPRWAGNREISYRPPST